jgi:hypothetical protein
MRSALDIGCIPIEKSDEKVCELFQKGEFRNKLSCAEFMSRDQEPLATSTLQF